MTPMPDSMRCVSCRRPLDAADRFCAACGLPAAGFADPDGTRVVEIDLEAPPEGVHLVGVTSPLTATKLAKGLGVLAVAAVAVAGVWLLAVDRGEADAQSVADAPVEQPRATAEQERVNLAADADTYDDLLAQSELEPEEIVALDIEGESLVVIDSTDLIRILDLESGVWTLLNAPEPLVDEPPLAVQRSLVVVGETQAWRIELGGDTGWSPVGDADRVRFSTIEDRLWLRTVNQKSNPTDAEFLWNEVELDGTVVRTMFRNRDLHFDTPELVTGIGGDVFRFTEAEVNPWRMFSPYGVLVATGRNDLVVKECNTQLVCERVWYDTGTGQARGPLYQDLASVLPSSYGARLAPDGRFVTSEGTVDGSMQVISTARGTAIANDCLWGDRVVWSAGSTVLVCATDEGPVMYATETRQALGRIEVGDPLRWQAVFIAG